MEKEIEIEEKTVKLIANNNEKNEEIEIHEENLIEFLEDNNEEFNLRDSLKQSGLWAAEKFSEVKVKKGKIKSTWETLWLYLRDENLLFFSSDDIKKPPKFLIILDNDCKITEQKKNSFSLEYSLPSTSKSKSSKAKTTSIMVDSDEDFKEWIEVISSACKSFKKPKTQYEEPKNLFPDDHLPLSIRVCSYNVNFGCCIRSTFLLLKLFLLIFCYFILKFFNYHFLLLLFKYFSINIIIIIIIIIIILILVIFFYK